MSLDLLPFIVTLGSHKGSGTQRQSQLTILRDDVNLTYSTVRYLGKASEYAFA